MTALRFALVGLAALAQDPVGKTSTDFRALADQCAGGGMTAVRAIERLPVEVASDYRGAFAAWRSMQEGRPRTILANALELTTIDRAEVVVTGILDKVEAIQGGVVDYHTVLLTFASGVRVERAPAEIAHELGQSRTFAMLRGTSHDAWLASLLVRHMRTTAGVHTFAFCKQDLRHVATPGEVERGLLLYECHLLPAAAGPVVLGGQR